MALSRSLRLKKYKSPSLKRASSISASSFCFSGSVRGSFLRKSDVSRAIFCSLDSSADGGSFWVAAVGSPGETLASFVPSETVEFLPLLRQLSSNPVFPQMRLNSFCPKATAEGLAKYQSAEPVEFVLNPAGAL